jgi:hypothetical protein
VAGAATARTLSSEAGNEAEAAAIREEAGRLMQAIGQTPSGAVRPPPIVLGNRDIAREIAAVAHATQAFLAEAGKA